MPKKIVLRIRSETRKEAEQTAEPEPEQSQVNIEPMAEKAVEVIETVEPEPVVEQAVQHPPKQTQEKADDLEEALKLYDEVMQEVQRLKKLDKNIILACIEKDVRPQLIRRFMARLNEKRSKVVEISKSVLEMLKNAKDRLGAEFADVEEELIWSSIELNTMQLEGDKTDAKNVGLKEELEARIPELRKKLTSLRNRIKTVEDMIKQLSDLPKNIVDLTTNKDEVAKIYEDAKKRYILTHGQRAEAVLRAEIERVAQQEAIPREYATILVWKMVTSR